MSTSQQPTPKRGDIFWADLPPHQSTGSEQYGKRPVVIVSADSINVQFPIAVIVPLTSNISKENRRHRIRILEAHIINEAGSTSTIKESVALTEQIRCVSRDRLGSNRVAKLKPPAIAAVEAGIRYVLMIP